MRTIDTIGEEVAKAFPDYDTDAVCEWKDEHLGMRPTWVKITLKPTSGGEEFTFRYSAETAFDLKFDLFRDMKNQMEAADRN